MGSEWPIVTVEEIALNTASGPFGSNIKAKEYVNSGVPLIRGINLLGPRFYDGDYVFLTDEKAHSLANAVAYPDDVIFVARGSVGSVGIVPHSRYRKYVISPNLIKLTVDREKAHPHFIFYYFRSWFGQQEIQSYVSTTGVPKIARALESMRKFRVLCPPLPEQRAIAHILGSLDDKIELNRQMNRTLEQMAQAIFKSWFIDFDPVRAKAEGRDPGLPKEIASLFPNSFEDSELGPIPKGWKIGTISDLAKVTSGKRPHKRSKEKTGEFTIPLYGGGGIMAYVPVRMISTPFLLTGRVGTLGKVFRITEECWPSDNTLLLFPNNKSCLEFLYFTLQRIDFDSLNRGSTQPLVTQTDLKNQKIVIPKENILIFYWQNAHPMFEKIDKNIAESRALASLRDTLLPKLISGELRVPDTEQLVEGMV